MLDDLLTLVQGSPIAQFVGGGFAYPVLEVVHLAGLAVLVGAAAGFDLRLLGVASSLPVRTVAGLLLPASRIGFSVAVCSGLLLFSSSAVSLAANPAFQLKVALLAVAGANIAVFHFGVYRRVGEWEVGDTPLPAVAAGAVSLVVWVGVIACGRWIAYA
ncbi:DUF6644 family protein [Saccharopolyspora sp. 5N708]|uniref:DUF6644 family protein n=1 Tax=Saccharopolyspora sp. 5N708 TaxID=3457424 RepID=UPI003FCFBC57